MVQRLNPWYAKKILETQMRILSKISFQGSLWLSAGMGLGTELRWENIQMGSTSFPRLATRQAPMAESMFISSTWDRTGFSQLLLFALESTVNLARWDCPSKNIWEVFKFSSVLTWLIAQVNFHEEFSFFPRCLHWRGLSFLEKSFPLEGIGPDRRFSLSRMLSRGSHAGGARWKRWQWWWSGYIKISIQYFSGP